MAFFMPLKAAHLSKLEVDMFVCFPFLFINGQLQIASLIIVIEKSCNQTNKRTHIVLSFRSSFIRKTFGTKRTEHDVRFLLFLRRPKNTSAQ